MRARCVEERVIRLNTASESVDSEEARAKQMKLRSGPGIRVIEATVPCANQRVPLASSGHHCHVTLGLKGDLRFGLASLLRLSRAPCRTNSRIKAPSRRPSPCSTRPPHGRRRSRCMASPTRESFRAAFLVLSLSLARTLQTTPVSYTHLTLPTKRIV